MQMSDIFSKTADRSDKCCVVRCLLQWTGVVMCANLDEKSDRQMVRLRLATRHVVRPTPEHRVFTTSAPVGGVPPAGQRR